MIVEKTYYQVKCDGCGAIAGSETPISAWDSMEWSRTVAVVDHGYLSEDDTHYCPDCTVWDESEDRRVPK